MNFDTISCIYFFEALTVWSVSHSHLMIMMTMMMTMTKFLKSERSRLLIIENSMMIIFYTLFISLPGGGIKG